METTLKNGRIVVSSRLPNGATGTTMKDGKNMTHAEWAEYKTIRGLKP